MGWTLLSALVIASLPPALVGETLPYVSSGEGYNLLCHGVLEKGHIGTNPHSKAIY